MIEKMIIDGHAHACGDFLTSENSIKNFDKSSFQLISTNRLESAISFFGTERIIFGSDSPYGKIDTLKWNKQNKTFRIRK
jgi:predicted TIM-barrel fold metal-dependent hydrolase